MYRDSRLDRPVNAWETDSVGASKVYQFSVGEVTCLPFGDKVAILHEHNVVYVDGQNVFSFDLPWANNSRRVLVPSTVRIGGQFISKYIDGITRDMITFPFITSRDAVYVGRVVQIAFMANADKLMLVERVDGRPLGVGQKLIVSFHKLSGNVAKETSRVELTDAEAFNGRTTCASLFSDGGYGIGFEGRCIIGGLQGTFMITLTGAVGAVKDIVKCKDDILVGSYSHGGLYTTGTYRKLSLLCDNMYHCIGSFRVIVPLCEHQLLASKGGRSILTIGKRVYDISAFDGNESSSVIRVMSDRVKCGYSGGSLIALVDAFNDVRVWNVESSVVVWERTFPTTVLACALNSDDTRIVVSTVGLVTCVSFNGLGEMTHDMADFGDGSLCCFDDVDNVIIVAEGVILNWRIFDHAIDVLIQDGVDDAEMFYSHVIELANTILWRPTCIDEFRSLMAMNCKRLSLFGNIVGSVTDTTYGGVLTMDLPTTRTLTVVACPSGMPWIILAMRRHVGTVDVVLRDLGGSVYVYRFEI